MTKRELSKLLVLDEKLGGIATDISAIEARVAAIEDRMVTRVDLVEIRNNLRKLEKRLTAADGKLAKMATKKDLKRMEKHLKARFDELFDFLNKDVTDNRRRLGVLENQTRQLQGSTS